MHIQTSACLSVLAEVQKSQEFISSISVYNKYPKSHAAKIFVNVKNSQNCFARWNTTSIRKNYGKRYGKPNMTAKQ